MAAALRQYQACLGIMVRLQVEDLTALKLDFDAARGRGLALHEFVSVMLDRVSAWDEASAVQFIEDLVELFAQVDVNGDGTMEWEEFTSAIIEGGMGTMGDDLDWRDLRYEENTAFADAINRPPKRVQYLSEFKRLLVYDNTRPVVEIVDPTALLPSPSEASADDAGKQEGDMGTLNPDPSSDQAISSCGNNAAPMLSIINKFHPLCYIAGYRRDQDDVRSERSPVQALKYLSKVDLLAVSGGDLKLTFWASTILTASSASALEMPLPLAIVHTPRPQRVLEWNPTRQHLYSISADLMITVWYVLREKHHDSKGRCEVSLFTTLKQHTDLLQDLLLLNSEMLVSCGMDNMIYLWDTETLRVRTTRQGHRRGVRLLTKLSNQLFLSAGFECEILGWDISALATAPVFKLWGHNAPVCCIQLIQSAAFASQRERRRASLRTGSDDSDDSASLSAAANATILGDQAITVDDDGWFKWWNLANITSMENNDLEQNSDRCLQTFRLGSDKYPWKAHTLAVLNNGQSVLAAGLHKLKLLQRVRLKPKSLPSSVVLFNSVSFTLLTTTDREIRVWDATSGILLRTFRNIASSDISCVDLDARQRKIVFGTQRGELVVLNYMNGAILKTWTPHQLNVSALIYCKEDQCVLTASWDRSLRLYDDNTSANALLRCITEAHDTDIKCMAYCYSMSLIATGSADGAIKIWDYIYFLLEDTCSLGEHSIKQSDVTALEFIEPYPLLVSCHENGNVCCWNVSPTQASTLLFYYAPFLRNPTTDPLRPISAGLDVHNEEEEQRGTVCCCQVFYDESGGEVLANDIRKGRFLLVTASLDGEICVDDFSPILALFNLKAFRAESLPSNHFSSYNPRRRFIRHGKNAKRLKNHLKHRQSGIAAAGGDPDLDKLPNGDAEPLVRLPNVKAGDVVQVSKWKAHQGVVRFLRTVEDPQAILTCSSDKSVRSWSFSGTSLGSLSNIQQPNVADGTSPGWCWPIDTTVSAQLKREQAEEIWESMKVQKLKVLAKRMQSVKMIDRSRRRNSLGLHTSVSVPNLPVDDPTRDQERTDPKARSQTPESALPTETDRLFRQLKGEVTWRQSDFQLARHVAWEKERAKFQHRMKRILKKKAKVPPRDESNQETSIGDEDTEKQDAMVAESLRDDSVAGDGTVDPASNLLPGNLSGAAHELPFDDKDNWSVGGLNRQKQMYGNFHHENVRRSQKVLLSKGSKIRKMQSMTNIDLTPSSFLMEQLGESCVIRENVALPSTLKLSRTPKKKSLQANTALGQSKSMVSLLSSTSLSSLSASSADVLADETKTPDPNGSATQSRKAGTGFPQVRSAPALVPQPTIKDLFLQTGTVEDKVQRASRILSRAGTARQEKPISLLANIQEHDSSTAPPMDKTPKQSSATRRVNSAERPMSSGMKGFKPSLRSAGASTKKLRIRSDVAIMRQDYFGTYSRDDVVSLYRTFTTIDKDKSGTITLRELVEGAGLFGSTHLRENVMGIFSSIDKDQSGHIDLKELCSAIFSEAPSEVLHDILYFCSVLESAEKAKRAKKSKLSIEQLKELKQLFLLYDTDRNGDIDVDELFNALRYNEKFYDDDNKRSRGGTSDTTGPNITRDDVERIIARFDVNTSSTLDLHEFIELFREDL